MEFKKRKIKVFKPTREQQLNAMNEVAKHFGNNYQLGSKDYPDMKVRGTAKQTTSIDLNQLNYSTLLFEEVVIKNYLDSESIMPLVEYRLENDGIFRIWESKYAKQ